MTKKCENCSTCKNKCKPKIMKDKGKTMVDEKLSQMIDEYAEEQVKNQIKVKLLELEEAEKTNHNIGRLVEKWTITGLLDTFETDEDKQFVAQLLENQASCMLSISYDGTFSSPSDKTVYNILIPSVVRVAKELLKLAKINNKVIKASEWPAGLYNDQTYVTVFGKNIELNLLEVCKCQTNLDYEIKLCEKLAEESVNQYSKLLEENDAVFPWILFWNPMLVKDNDVQKSTYIIGTRYGVIKKI